MAYGAKIEAVWGIVGIDRTPGLLSSVYPNGLPRYDDRFEMRTAAAQRALLAACALAYAWGGAEAVGAKDVERNDAQLMAALDASDNGETLSETDFARLAQRKLVPGLLWRASESPCPIAEFAAWRRAQGQDFPVRPAQNHAYETCPRSLIASCLRKRFHVFI
jgi:hypothetical protein